MITYSGVFPPPVHHVRGRNSWTVTNTPDAPRPLDDGAFIVGIGVASELFVAGNDTDPDPTG